MSKAFFKEDTPPDDDEEFVDANPVPTGSKNYMTPAGHAQLQAEFDQLWKVERPKLVETVAWAASNGDRSENGDYLYGKKRLREIDRRLRFLGKRLDNAEVVDPATRDATDQVIDSGEEQTVSIVGIDEADVGRGRISWVSPMARALTKAREGDEVTLRTPAGDRHLEVAAVRYEALD
ncbi:MAG: transcription elongation factor GreB [Betaproteobacteria bacterium]|nr:transcription elongation factor GreB [Betaproteobacteria bacterium]